MLVHPGFRADHVGQLLSQGVPHEPHGLGVPQSYLYRVALVLEARLPLSEVGLRAQNPIAFSQAIGVHSEQLSAALALWGDQARAEKAPC